MRVALACVVAACGGSRTEPGAGSTQPPPTPPPSLPHTVITCTQLPFADSTPVPEASGAAWLPIDGKLALVVIADSGNAGAYALVDPDTGETREQGELPLGSVHDDLEGAAVLDGKLVAVTSAGWIRTWERAARGFTLVDGPYPLGPIDLPDRGGGLGGNPPDGAGMVCPERGSNCGRNYEGLCLAPNPAGPCIGFVAAKADGHLYCVGVRDGKLAVDRGGAIAIAKPGMIADCAFSDTGVLYVGSNFFDAARVYRVDGWQAPATARVTEIGELGTGFPETIAARGEIIYRMSDTGGSPSVMTKYRCR